MPGTRHIGCCPSRRIARYEDLVALAQLVPESDGRMMTCLAFRSQTPSLGAWSLVLDVSSWETGG